MPVFRVQSPSPLPGSLLLLLLLLLLTSAAPGKVQGAGDVILQGVVGAASFDSDSLTFEVEKAEGGEEEDLSSMPYVGLISQYLFADGSTQVGVEGGVLFGWRSRDTTIVAGSNQAGSNQIVVKVDSSLWLLDLSVGVCLNQKLGPRWRLYLAAGPAMVFGEYDEDKDIRSQEDISDPAVNADSESESESEFGVGGYARAGLEYEFAPQSLVGFSVRALATDLKFDNTVDASELSGVQAFVTFTRNFGN